MTNSFNDIHNSKVMFLLGGNPAEAHPVSMLHLLHAKENGAKLIVVDPRFTRTAAHADEYVRIRSGTDVAFLWGVLHEILANGWEDKDYIAKRVWRFDDVRKEVEPWTAEETERVTGAPADQVRKVAKMISDLRPGTLIWCMGLTQSSIGINKVRAACIVQLALGKMLPARAGDAKGLRLHRATGRRRLGRRRLRAGQRRPHRGSRAAGAGARTDGAARSLGAQAGARGARSADTPRTVAALAR